MEDGVMEGVIPIIDLSLVKGSLEQIPSTLWDSKAVEFGKAMEQVGFAYVINHGVDMSKVSELYATAKEFFSLPKEIKTKYMKMNAAINWHGYGGPGLERLNEIHKNSTELREFFDAWGFEQFDETKFPHEVPDLKALFDTIRPQTYQVAKTLLSLMGTYLKLKGALEDDKYFLKKHKCLDNYGVRTATQFRTLHYYPMDPMDSTIPENAIRCGEHSDWGSITLLIQDMVGGLEVKRRDGGWIEAKPVVGAIIVNSGQLMELWSCGVFPATPHRVRILDEERTRTKGRQSLVHFINPDGGTVVKPVVKCPPGDSKYTNRDPVVAFDWYLRLMADATQGY